MMHASHEGCTTAQKKTRTNPGHFSNAKNRRLICSLHCLLSDFRFPIQDVLARFGIVLFDLKLFGLELGVLGRGVEVTSTGGRNEFDNISWHNGFLFVAF
jgi:hypothetical protein